MRAVNPGRIDGIARDESSASGHGVRAACYYRKSSDLQEASIEQQQAEVRAFAKRLGYHVVEEFMDSGKSGSRDQEKRTEFRRMIEAAESRSFEVILCWSTNRFARLDSLEGAALKALLRAAGVRLETVKEGKIDWTSFAGRLIDLIYSETDHRYSQEISANSLRGRLHALQQGYWPNGSVPFGYDRLYVEPSGKTHIVRRNEDFGKPRGWKLKLVVNEREASVVRSIFQDVSERGTSFRQIAKNLNSRGVPSPSASRGGWTMGTVRGLLAHKAYVGVAHIGIGRQRQKTAFNRAGAQERPGCCPAIVDEGIFTAVQEQLAAKREIGLRPQSTRASALSGTLVCGLCGYRMEKKPPYKGRVYFTCPSALRRPQLGCSHWRVYEDEMLAIVTGLLRDKIGEERLRAIQASPGAAAADHAVLLEERAIELRKQINRGRERYLTAPDHLMAGLAVKLKDWETELSGLDDKLRLAKVAQSSDARQSYVRWLGDVMGKLTVVKEIEWGHAQSQREPIVISESDKIKLRKELGGRAGRCLADWDDGQITFGKGQVVELDDQDQAWLWREVEGPVSPAIMIEADVLREFLRKLGVKVTLYWKRKFKRQWELDRGKLEARVGQHVSSTHTATRAPATSTGISEQAPTSRARSWSR